MNGTFTQWDSIRFCHSSLYATAGEKYSLDRGCVSVCARVCMHWSLLQYDDKFMQILCCTQTTFWKLEWLLLSYKANVISLCSYFVQVINRYNLLMGWVYVQWPYVFSKNLLTKVLFEPMSFLYSSHTWHRTLIWPDSLAVANVCKLSLGVFLYQAPVLSTSLKGDFSISFPSISFSV